MRYRIVPLLVCFMVLSAVLSMFIDSITVVLFLATVTLELAQTHEVRSRCPMILSEIFCANLGGAATMCGDPPNIIIGTSLGYTFFDFISNTGVAVAICFVLVLIYFVPVLPQASFCVTTRTAVRRLCPEPGTAITNRRAFLLSAGVFLLAVVLAGHPRPDGADRGLHRRDRGGPEPGGDRLHQRREGGSGDHQGRGL